MFIILYPFSLPEAFQYFSNSPDKSIRQLLSAWQTPSSIVPTLLRGNAACDAPASRQAKDVIQVVWQHKKQANSGRPEFWLNSLILLQTVLKSAHIFGAARSSQHGTLERPGLHSHAGRGNEISLSRVKG
jgi:hypothetical protein